MRSLVTLLDWSHDDVRAVLDRARKLREEAHRGERRRRFEGRTLAMLFEKRSTRTRAAFETAFGEEGGHPVFLSSQDIQLGAKETIEDTARILGGMFDIIQFRGFAHASVEALANHAGVPVINGLTDSFHPTQALADLMTLEMEGGPLEESPLVFVGDGANNVAASLIVAGTLMGVPLSVVCPPERAPNPALIGRAEAHAREAGRGGTVRVSHDPADIPASTRAIYTDVWASMGEEAKSAERIALLTPYRVDAAMMDRAPEAIFLHCLPAVRGNEMNAEVIDGPRSRVFVQAENRKHTIKAAMLACLDIGE